MCGKVEKYLFFSSKWTKFNLSGKGGRDEFFIDNSDQEDLHSCHLKKKKRCCEVGLDKVIINTGGLDQNATHNK